MTSPSIEAPLPPEPKADFEAIKRYLNILNPEGGVVELMALDSVELSMRSKKVTVDSQEIEVPTWTRKNSDPQYQRRGPTVGYFNDIKLAARAAACLNHHGRSSVYTRLQSVSAALLARAKNRLSFRGRATEDDEVDHYRYLGIDIDPVRPADVMATDEEMGAAHSTALRIAEFLCDRSFPDPLILASGSGRWLIYAIDLLPITDQPLIEADLRALAGLFSDDKCELDTKIANPGRLCPVVGTVKMKGDHTPDVGRPWRICEIIALPDGFGTHKVSREQLQALAALEAPPPADAPRVVHEASNGTSKLEGPERWFRWIDEHHVPVRKRRDRAYGTTFEVDCLEQEAGHDGKGYLTVFHGGAVAAGCLSTHCSWTWRELRSKYDPQVTSSGQDTGGNGNRSAAPALKRQGAAGNQYKVGDTIFALDQENYGKILSLSDGGATVHFVSEDGTEATVFLPFNLIQPTQGGGIAVPGLPTGPAEPYQPYPVARLPLGLREFVQHAAQSIGCDAAYVAVPVVAVICSVIGNARKIRCKHGYCEPAVVWAAVVGDSGTLKSPALEVVLYHLRAIQAALFVEYEKARVEFEKDRLMYDAKLADWKKKGLLRGDPPEKPEPPICPRLIISNATIEAVAEVLDGNPRGVLLARDELGAWLGSFGEYKGGKGGDAQNWLEAWRANEWLIDRKTGVKKTIRIPRAAISVTGTVQPGPLKRSLGLEHFENGLAARFLFCMPPPRVARWNEAVIPPPVEDAFKQIVTSLYALQSETDKNGERVPVEVEFSRDGKSAYVEFYNKWAEESEDLSGPLAAAWSKLKGYTARLALIFHLVREATGEVAAKSAVDERDVRAAVAIVRWFGHETRRLYSRLAESEEARAQRELVELISRKGGRITARDLARATRRFGGDAEAAEQALEALVQAGHGVWEELPPGATGGRPSREFVLKTAGPVDETPPEPGEDRGFVDTEGGTSPQNEEPAGPAPGDEEYPPVDETPTNADESGGFVDRAPGDEGEEEAEWEG